MLLTHRTNLRGTNTTRDRVGVNESDVLMFWLLSNSVIYKHSCCWHRVESLKTSHDDFLSTAWKKTLNRAGGQQYRINKTGSFCSNICLRLVCIRWFAYGGKLFCASANYWQTNSLSKSCSCCESVKERKSKVMTHVAGVELWCFMLNVHSLLPSHKSSRLL